MHVAEDVRVGVGVRTLGRTGAAGTAAGVVLALAVLGLLVATGLRRPLRSLALLDVGWATAALVDHPLALTRPGAFRHGLESAVPVIVLVGFTALSALLLVGPGRRQNRAGAH
ncbi:MAG: hypothetical protein NVS3B26_21140 [Mycobacteriales bacterium]